MLLRGGEVVAGAEIAALRRPGVRPRDWCRGPARLASTLGLTGADTGQDICAAAAGRAAGPLVVRGPSAPIDPADVRTGPRVGVAGAGGDAAAYPWRFWLDGDPTVSRYKPGRSRAVEKPV